MRARITILVVLTGMALLALSGCGAGTAPGASSPGGGAVSVKLTSAAQGAQGGKIYEYDIHIPEAGPQIVFKDKGEGLACR